MSVYVIGGSTRSTRLERSQDAVERLLLQRSAGALARRSARRSSCDCNAVHGLVPKLELKVVDRTTAGSSGQRIGRRREELVGQRRRSSVHRAPEECTSRKPDRAHRAYAMNTDALRSQRDGLATRWPAGLARAPARRSRASERRSTSVGTRPRARWQDGRLDEPRGRRGRAGAAMAAPDDTRRDRSARRRRGRLATFVTSPSLGGPQWQHGGDRRRRAGRRAGRAGRGVGTVNHCIHGKDAVVEEVLDWRPNDYVTVPLAARPIPSDPAARQHAIVIELGRRRRHRAVELRFGAADARRRTGRSSSRCCRGIDGRPATHRAATNAATADRWRDETARGHGLPGRR